MAFPTGEVHRYYLKGGDPKLVGAEALAFALADFVGLPVPACALCLRGEPPDIWFASEEGPVRSGIEEIIERCTSQSIDFEVGEPPSDVRRVCRAPGEAPNRLTPSTSPRRAAAHRPLARSRIPHSGIYALSTSVLRGTQSERCRAVPHLAVAWRGGWPRSRRSRIEQRAHSSRRRRHRC